VAIKEGWGNDVVDVVLTDSWRDLDAYITKKSRDDKSLAMVASLVATHYETDIKITRENSKTCPYNIVVDKPLQKDKIEVYFCDVRLANLIKNLELYPQDRLLAGPIGNYASLKEQSSNLLHFLNNSKDDAANNVHYIKISSKSPSSTAKVDLNENTEWYMYAFRNDALYYSYMALPCSPFNTCTLKEQMLTAAEKELNAVAPQ
jgi:cytochrome c biogenesis protein ResB